MKDMVNKGRQSNARGEQTSNVIVTAEAVIAIRSRYRPHVPGLTKALADEFRISVRNNISLNKFS